MVLATRRRLAAGWQAAVDALGGMQQGIPVAIPGRQIGRWQWRYFVQIGKARIGIESEFTTKYA
jgi:hypothetical protein